MIGEVNACLKEGRKERNKRASKTLQNKEGDAIATCCFEAVRLLITLEIFSSEINMGEGIAAWYEVLGISVKSAFGMGGKNRDFRALAFSAKVVAKLLVVTRSGMVRGVGADGFFLLPTLLTARCLLFLLQHRPQPA